MNRLKELRQEKGLTQQALADEIGVFYRTIQNWENGKSQIKPEKAQQLADYFGVSVGYLLGYSDADDIFFSTLEKYGTVKKSEKDFLFELSDIEEGRETFLEFYDKNTIKQLIQKTENKYELDHSDAIRQINYFFRGLTFFHFDEIELLSHYVTLDSKEQEIVLDFIRVLASKHNSPDN